MGQAHNKSSLHKQLSRWLQGWRRFLANSQVYVSRYGRQMVTYGVVMGINFPLFLLIWGYRDPQDRESLILRIIATLLCVGLALKRWWPKQLKPILPIYWYVTLCFTLPFFFIYLSLVNGGDTLWLMNVMSAVFFLYLVVDALSAISLLLLGAGIAYGVFRCLHGDFVYHTSVTSLSGVLVTLGAAVIIGSVFSRNRDQIAKQKLTAMRLVAGSIAHELRTPLASIKFAMNGFLKFLPKLTDTYQAYYQDNPDKHPDIRQQHFKVLNNIPSSVTKEIDRVNLVIDTFLKNVDIDGIDRDKLTALSVDNVIRDALARYPYADDKQAALIHYECCQDFHIKGDHDLLLHVVFNLMKNAFYFIAKAGKGEISIAVDDHQGVGKIVFKDTSTGIPATAIKHVFDKFYSQRKNGTGIGLAFCQSVIEAFDGNISCQSELGEYTTFTITFNHDN